MQKTHKQEEITNKRNETQREAIFSALNGIFQLTEENGTPSSKEDIEFQFLKAAKLMVDRGFGDIVEEFVLGRMDSFGEKIGRRILAKIEEIKKPYGYRDLDERPSGIRLKEGPGPVAAKPTNLLLVKNR